jgi:hypothetical protein
MLVDTPCQQYDSQVRTWQFLQDVYDGLMAWSFRDASGALHPTSRAQAYLPKLPGEEQYLDRFRRTPFERQFGRSIDDFVRIIFNNGITVNLPPMLERQWNNLDSSGNPAMVVLPQLAIASQVCGHHFVLVDSPADGGMAYWRSLSPLQIINWDVSLVDGIERCTWAVIKLRLRRRQGYEEVFEDFYQELFPDRWYLWRIETDDRGRKNQRLEREGRWGRRVDGALEPYPYVPLFSIYAGNRLGFFRSQPPHLSLADLNVAHYNIQGDHLHKVRRTCYPQAVAIGATNADKITLGPSTVIRPPLGGDFRWAEPLALSIEQSRLELERFERKIDYLGTEYLIKPADRQAAASVLLQAYKVESSLHLFAASFAAGINHILRFQCWLSRVEWDDYGVSLDTTFYRSQAKSPEMLANYINLARLLGESPTLSPAQEEVVSMIQSKFIED